MLCDQLTDSKLTMYIQSDPLLSNFLQYRREEGLLGFYAGIVPHLLGEVSGKAIEVLIQEIVEKAEVHFFLFVSHLGCYRFSIAVYRSLS